MITYEFLGLPGAGKTHYLNKLSSKENIWHYDHAMAVCLNRTPWRRILFWKFPNKVAKRIMVSLYKKSLSKNYYNKFLQNHPDFAGFVLSYRDKLGTDYWRWLQNTMALYQLFDSKLKKDEKVFFDEGLVQRAYSLYFIDRDLEKIKKYLDLLPPIDNIVYVECDVDTSYDRLKERGFTKRLKDMPEDQVREHLQQAKELIDFIVGYFQDKQTKILNPKDL